MEVPRPADNRAPAAGLVARGTALVDEIRHGLEQELRITRARLREQGWPVDSGQLAGVTLAWQAPGADHSRVGDLVSDRRRLDRAVSGAGGEPAPRLPSCTIATKPSRWAGSRLYG